MASSVINISINANVRGSNNVMNLTADLQAMAKAAENAKKSMDFEKFASTCSSLVVSTQGVLGALDPLTASFEGFDAAMRQANTMAGKDGAGFERLKSQVMELGAELRGVSREALAGGLYQAISNGVPEDNWISFLEASAKASVGGLADLGGVVTVTSTIIKNYGLEWEEAAAIQDKIQTTAKNGVTSFEQLQQALPRVTGNAATLGVSIDELMASFATLTGVSGNTAEVSTQIAAIFTALVKPSSQAAKMAEEMGIQFDAAAIRAAGGFQQFLSQLDASVKSYSQASGVLEQEVYAKLFGSAESLRALGPLTGQLAETYAKNVEAMAGSTGAIGEAYEQMGGTAAAGLEQMKNRLASLTDSAAAVVSRLKPVISTAAQITQGVSGITAFGGALVKAGKSAAELAQKIKNAKIAAELFGNTAKAALVTSGIGAAVLAIAAAVSHFSAKAEEARAKTEALRKSADGVRASIRESYTSALASASAEIERHRTELKGLMDSNQSTAAKVSELNSAYGPLLGTFKTAAEWYDILAAKAKAYVEAQAYQTMATSAFQTKVGKESELQDLEDQRRAVEGKIAALKEAGEYEGQKAVAGGTGGVSYTTYKTDAAKELDSQLADIADSITAKTREIQTAAAEYDKAVASMTAAQSQLKSAAPAAKPSGADGAKAYASAAGLAAQAQAAFNASVSQSASEAQASNSALADLSDTVSRLSAGAKAAQLSASGLVRSVENSAMTATLQGCNDAMQRLRSAQNTASGENLAGINREIKAIEEKQKALRGLGVEDGEAAPARNAGLGDIAKGWGDIKGIASGIESIGKVADKAASPWERLSAAIDGALAVMQGISGIIDLMKTLGIIAPATAAAEVAAHTSTTIAAEADTNAQLADAAAKTMNAHAWMPFVGIGLAAAAVGVMIATMAGLPKFAQGGIAYGPTVGMFGEYPGARSNPEVVAPLSRLQALLGESGGSRRATEMKLRGRTLVAAIGREQHLKTSLK